MQFSQLFIGDKFVEPTYDRDTEIQVFIKVDDEGAIAFDTGEQYFFYSFSKVIKLKL